MIPEIRGSITVENEINGSILENAMRGYSPYELAKRNGFVGTEEEWLASLKGDKGDIGLTPDISIGNVTTGQPGTNAEVSVSGTPENPVMDFTIPRGDVGATPNITIGTVVTGEEGAQAQASITGTPENPVLNLTIPRGNTGDDGFNPVVEVTKDGNTATVSVTDATHTTEVNIVDGYTPQKNVDYFDGHSPKITGAKSQGTTFIYSDGEQIGAIADGQDGYTPRKGVDYFDGHTPAISGEKIDDTTFIYADGVRIATVLDGLDGNSPVITTVKSGKTTSILADSVVIGTISDGADGHSPTITTTKSGKTTTILSDGTSIGTVSDGQDGHSPTITTNKVGKTLSILSDGQTIGTVSDGADGQDAITPTITTNKSGTTTTIYSNGVAIGTVEDGVDGSTPVITATKSEGITTIKANGVDIATINDGISGDDGYSPTASVVKSGGISTLTVTDKSGTTSTQILDGTGMTATDPNDDGNVVLVSTIVGVEVDQTPTDGSINAVSSGGVYDELEDIRDDLSQKYERPSSGIPASDIATGVIPDVSGKLDAPQTAGTQGQVLTSDGNGGQSWEDPTGGVTDVQINNTSVVTDGVANVPVAAIGTWGVTQPQTDRGIGSTDGKISISPATDNHIKNGNMIYFPVCTAKQHAASFYGLAKAAGDTTQSQSSNAVGQYTEDAKSKIHDMLDAPVTVSGTTPTITGKAGIRYVCGEVSTLSITAPESGCIDVVFTSGSTPTVLTVTSAKTGVTAIKWMNGFDPTNLDADTTYEVNILDGELGVAGSWT